MSTDPSFHRTGTRTCGPSARGKRPNSVSNERFSLIKKTTCLMWLRASCSCDETSPPPGLECAVAEATNDDGADVDAVQARPTTNAADAMPAVRRHRSRPAIAGR